MRRLIAGLLLLMAVSAHAAAGDAPPPSIPNFVLDLRSESADSVLPFGEIFNIRSAVDTSTTGGKLEIFPSEKCKQAADRVGGELTGRLVKFKTGTEDVSQLLFSAPELKPNKTYCFAFHVESKLIDPATSIRFRTELTQQLDEMLRNNDIKGVSHNELVNLRANVRAVAKRMSALQNVEIITPDTSPLSINADDKRLQVAFEQLLRPVIDAQVNRTLAIQNYCTNRGVLIAEIGHVQTSSKVQDVLKAIDAERLTKADVGSLLTGTVTSFDRVLFTGNGDDDIAQTLQRDDSCNASNAPDSLVNAWLPNALDSSIQQTRAIASDVDAVLAIVRALRNDQLKIAKEVNVTAAQIDAADKELNHLHGTALAVNGAITRAKTQLEKREDALDLMVKGVEVIGEQDITLLTSSTPDFMTRANYYISADVGFAHIFDPNDTFTYAGINIYPHPVNKHVPAPLFPSRDAWSRLSFMIGASINDVSEEGSYTGVLGGKALVGAIGYRLFESIRVSGGYAGIKRSNANPLITKQSVEIDPFVAFSIDWDVQSTLGKLGSVLSFNK
ncbi:MAG TPA: hypothetical protein VN797_00770 [Gemmatimonadaceae bacterium]|nr:hypothetical protein [Gemmatimonadaceae bacterium]